MRHHIFTHQRNRFGGQLFAGLLVLLLVLALLFLFRRHNLRKSGVQPKPIGEDLNDIYQELQDRFASRDFSGIVNYILGKGPIVT